MAVGVIEFNNGPADKTIGTTPLGILPSPVSSLTLETDITVRTGLLCSVDNLVTIPSVDFYKVEKDTNITSPTFGEVKSREFVSVVQQTLITGGFLVTLKDDGSEQVPPLLYLTEQKENQSSVFVRKPTGVLFSRTLHVKLILSNSLEVGNYQGELVFYSGSTPIGTFLFLADIQDANKMFQGTPTTVWYHNA